MYLKVILDFELNTLYKNKRWCTRNKKKNIMVNFAIVKFPYYTHTQPTLDILIWPK